MPPDMPEIGTDPVGIDDLGKTLGVESRVVTEYLELGLVSPGRGGTICQSLSAPDLARLSRALRLAHDLELHAAAAALLVDLLEEWDRLLRHVSRLERTLAGAD
jgi:hypothetical protein